MEQQLIAEKARLDDRAKGERLRQIQLLEEANQACRARMERDMADEAEAMREEVAHKRRLLEYELKSKLEDERIVALELQAQRRMAALEQVMPANGVRDLGPNGCCPMSDLVIGNAQNCKFN